MTLKKSTIFPQISPQYVPILFLSLFTGNGHLGVAVPVAGKKNTFVGGAGTDFVEITWNPKWNNPKPRIKVLATVDGDRQGTRFNDGKVDPKGRFWGGKFKSSTISR